MNVHQHHVRMEAVAPMESMNIFATVWLDMKGTTVKQVKNISHYLISDGIKSFVTLISNSVWLPVHLYILCEIFFIQSKCQIKV